GAGAEVAGGAVVAAGAGVGAAGAAHAERSTAKPAKRLKRLDARRSVDRLSIRFSFTSHLAHQHKSQASLTAVANVSGRPPAVKRSDSWAEFRPEARMTGDENSLTRVDRSRTYGRRSAENGAGRIRLCAHPQPAPI